MKFWRRKIFESPPPFPDLQTPRLILDVLILLSFSDFAEFNQNFSFFPHCWQHVLQFSFKVWLMTGVLRYFIIYYIKTSEVAFYLIKYFNSSHFATLNSYFLLQSKNNGNIFLQVDSTVDRSKKLGQIFFWTKIVDFCLHMAIFCGQFYIIGQNVKVLLMTSNSAYIWSIEF